MRSLLAFLALSILTCAAQEPRPLEGTQPFTTQGDLSAQMVAGIARWLERETDHAADARRKQWLEAAGSERWDAFLEEKRERLRRMLGVVDRRTPGAIEELRTVNEAKPGAAHAAGDSVLRVRWPVFDGLFAEGVLLLPAGPPRALMIVLPDAAEPPEEEAAFAPRLVGEGFAVLVPVLVDRREKWSGSEALQRFTNQPHREWIYRQAFEMGRTIIGYEAQKVLAAIDAITSEKSPLGLSAKTIGIAGFGEGGLLALHCAALDPRIAAALVSGYFGPRERLFEEPIYRNVFGLLRDFGDAELAAMIAPRALVIEHSRAPAISGPPKPSPGRTGAAPGVVRTPEMAAVAAEIEHANTLRAALKPAATPVTFIHRGDGQALESGSADAARAFLAALKFPPREGGSLHPAPTTSEAEVNDDRQRRAVRDLEQFTQSLVPVAERLRNETIWAKVKPGEDWEKTKRDLHARLSEQAIGKLAGERVAPNPRTRLIREEPKWLGYEVALDVRPDVFAWGWLLVPRDLKPGEKRPVVVCQHGLEGIPEDTVTQDPAAPGFRFYQGFAARLAEQGFIVYAPHNPYRGHDEFRVLQRRANPLGLSLFSFIIAQHGVATDWLASLPFVDPARIGFYGLSYGGKTAMRVPALVDRYCLSICSGDFNEWIRKNVNTDLRLSYMFTGEYEMFEWNLASVANYAEMAMLIAPRPFMVERGHLDGVATDEWVGYEFSKVRRGYTRLGIPERTELEWFDGPHMIHGIGTFEFLHKHLTWPAAK